MLNKTTTAPENRRPWSWYRVGAPEEHLSGSVLLRSCIRVGAPEEPGSAILRSGHLPPTGHRQPAPPRRRELAARGHWQATWEASPGRHPCQMAKPERRRNSQTTQPRRPHRPPSHNARSQRWTPRRKRGDPRSGKKRHCQRRTYPPGDRPGQRDLAG